jgi:hypothetical protein
MAGISGTCLGARGETALDMVLVIAGFARAILMNGRSSPYISKMPGTRPGIS